MPDPRQQKGKERKQKRKKLEKEVSHEDDIRDDKSISDKDDNHQRKRHKKKRNRNAVQKGSKEDITKTVKGSSGHMLENDRNTVKESLTKANAATASSSRVVVRS